MISQAQSISTLTTLDPDAEKWAKETETEDYKSDFMELLVTQLQYQDPLEPMENQEFTGQLAQFEALGQATSTNQLLNKLVDATVATNMDKGMGYMGKAVVIEGDRVEVKDGKGTLFLETEETADVTVRVYSDVGEVVWEKTINNVEAGELQVSLEGTGVPDGKYTFAVSAIDGDGGRVTAHPLEVGIVTGVLTEEDGVKLDVSGRTADMSSVRRINSSESSFDQLLAAQNGANVSNGINYIGKQVVVDGNRMTVANDTGLLYLDLDRQADVEIKVLNGSGDEVYTKKIEGMTGGGNSVTLPNIGLDDGDSYTFTVTARSGDESTEVSPREYGVVQAVMNKNNVPYLDIEGRMTTLDKIMRIEQQTS